MSIAQIKEDRYKELISKSVSDYGNYFRINKALNKSKNSTITIAFLGGSVTEGYNPKGMISENYAELFCRYIREKYCVTGNCICVNTGYASANAMNGLAYAELKVKDELPDIAFVEFAINNAMDRTYITAFESLIYKLLIMKSGPAVIPVIICSSEFYTCSSYMEIVAKYYDLPVVNLYNTISFGLENKIMAWSDYSNDYAHPTRDGHKLITDCIIKLFESRNKQDSFYRIPDAACYSREFYTFKFVDHNQLLPEESCEFIPSDTLEEFPAGWNYVKNGLCRSFRFQTACKSLFVAYEQCNSVDYGMAEIWDNGNMISTLEGYSIYSWGNPDFRLVLNEAEASLHRIEIRMYQGDEDKKFAILGFGIVS